MEEKNKTNDIKKKKIIKITLYTLCLILILAIGSFAVYTANVPGTALNKLLVASPDFKFNFTESNSVTLNNPKNSDKQDFAFNVKGSSKETNYMFDIDYSIYLIVNTESTISNDKVYVQLFDKDNKKITDATTISNLTKVENKDNEYVLKTNNMILSNQTKTDNYILKYWYDSNKDIEYTKDTTNQAGTYTNVGNFNMTVNVSMNKFDYGKVESLSITTAPKKTAYNVGETFDPTGMVLQATLNNDTTKSITDTNDLKISPSTTLTASDTSVTITYATKTVTQAISVVDLSKDTSGANAPVLTSNMIPVYYDDANSVWRKADSTNKTNSAIWYNYDYKMWANAVTVTDTNRSTYLSADAGTEISMDDINTMWVWIPRYTYTYLNTNTPEEIKIKFESGTSSSGTIKCTDAVASSGTTSQTCTDTTNGSLKAGTSTYTHPAFTFGDTELTGLWVGKFESSATTIPTSTSTTESTIIIKPNVQSLRNKAVSYQFRDARQMEKANNVYGFPQSSSTTFNWNGNLTGDTNNIDIHMMKNTEWGAVAYLSHSKYGRCTSGTCEELTINNCSTYTTGIGADEVSASRSSTTCTTDKNKYNGESGVKASTTGNVYGVYDMSGGSYEYTMGNMVNSSNQFQVSSASNWSTTTYPLSKYYDSYTYNTSDTEYTRGRLGDATVEMAPSSSSKTTWYSEYAYFPISSKSWFERGGSCYNATFAGAFYFYNDDGAAIGSYSFRASLGALD